ncbi:MAG: NAD(P)H-dependent oxidoreductase [Methanobacterium sp.]|uniref:NAD(P)H-dependent oxidoreductase n=1 Tax=Methanobacterium sp. TaxID=2164 RepID=UPI003C75D7AF
MKITVLNGSPKGELSITVQYIKFIQKSFPEHEFDIINISQRIKKIENNKDYFKEIIENINSSNAIIWAFPLYVFLVASQYKRFIELITERNTEHAFKDKYTCVITTSINFYDHTAHNYMHAVCDDLNMKYLGFYSAEMRDLLDEDKRKNLTTFSKNFFEDIKSNVSTSKSYTPITPQNFDYVPSINHMKRDKNGKKLVIISDSNNNNSNLSLMVEKFKNSFKGGIESYNLNDIDMKGGCLGCLECSYNNICVYQGKDGFVDFYNELKDFDIIIFAGSLKDRYLSSKWKQFFDRGFFYNHIPIFKNKQIGFIISGTLNQNRNLNEILEGYCEWQHANLVNFVTDEIGDSDVIDKQIQNLARQMLRAAESDYIRPPTFLGVGGAKIFRDAIYGKMRFPFQSDHKYYKANGLYNFPYKNTKTRIQNLTLTLLTKIPRIRREIYNKRMKKEMIKPFEDLLL